MTTKSLMEEALVDAVELRKLALQNAEQEVLRAVQPRLRRLLDLKLLGESLDDEDQLVGDDADAALVELTDDGGLVDDLSSLATPTPDESQIDSAVSLTPDGKIQLDVDKLAMTMLEPSTALPTVVDDDQLDVEVPHDVVGKLVGEPPTESPIIDDVLELESALKTTAGVASVNKIARSRMFESKINRLSEQIDDMYCRAENVDEGIKAFIDVKIQRCRGMLDTIRENMMKRKVLDEATLEFKFDEDELEDADISADDLSKLLGDVDVQLGTDDEGDAGEGDEGDDEGGDELDLDLDLDTPAEEPSGSDGGDVEESDTLDDDQEVEVDENMLRREIMRMRKLAEEHPKNIIDDFGGGEECGEPFIDGSVTTENRRANASARKNAGVVRKLSKELHEQKFYNAKLLYTNRILANESLTPKQKSSIIKRFDAAKNLREVRLIYSSLVSAMVNPRRNVTESHAHRVGGSSSSPTRKASSQLNESVSEYNRWLEMAGIK